MKKSSIDQLHEMILGYLDVFVNKPVAETITQNFYAQDQVADFLVILNFAINAVMADGIDFDKDYLQNLPKEEIEKRIEVLENFVSSQNIDSPINGSEFIEAQKFLSEGSSRKYLLPYLNRELNWVSISILSASYISSLVLLRAVFELIIGIATKETGSMKDRINTITILESIERKKTLKLWYRLCAWGHPYGKWVKEICPGYVAHTPMYHPSLCEICIQTLEQVFDFLVVILFSKFEIDMQKLAAFAKEMRINLGSYELINSRIDA